MDCPVCGGKLREIERSGVTVDICPSCKGVWLDRGEIEKIIAVEAREDADTALAGEHVQQPRNDERDRAREHGLSGRRRSSLLSDLLGGLGGD